MPRPADGPRRHRATSTSNFGVGARESHDASGFYDRFRTPALSSDDTVLAPLPVAEPFVCGDARAMHTVADGAVALVVTSPPYFAGKQYEEELERDGVPASYLEYLQMLTAVFAECVRTLEPGGRIAVNVANLGRKPYRSLSADVLRILEHDLGLLLRGELVWRKGEGASGSCAWGSYRSAANPVLRDITERVIVASKGRFDRARTRRVRAAEGLPHRATIGTDDFLASTLDVWELPSESAQRIGHPAPFPVELPEQLIQLYTYADDLVLDPFMGSGSTLVAAARTGRRFVGYDLDPDYVAMARERVAVESGQRTIAADETRLGTSAGALAEQALVQSGFAITKRNVTVRGSGVRVAFDAVDTGGRRWLFGVAGPNTGHRGGLLRTEAVWRALGQAAAVRGALGVEVPLVLLTTALPRPRTPGAASLDAARTVVLTDVIDICDADDRARLATLASSCGPAPGTGMPGG